VLKLPHHQNKICHHYFIITKIKATLLNVITNTGVAPSKTPAPAILRRLGTVVAVAAVGASEVVVAAVASVFPCETALPFPLRLIGMTQE
jgi:hypothetical protein